MKTLVQIALLVAAVSLIANGMIDARTGPAAFKLGFGAALLATWHCVTIGRKWQ